MKVTRVDGVGQVAPADWDALAGDDDPFAEHAFLSVLEDSGSVGGRSGWRPAHVLVHDGGTLVGALPLYRKDHSYGEYIFDFAWANAAARLGSPYYPKLVAMTPLTPATGTRLLVHPSTERAHVVKTLLDGALVAASELHASSVHLNFLNAQEAAEVATHGAYLARTTHQFHFHNEGYADFEDFVGRFRSSMRKKLRKERRAVAESGLDVGVTTGEELSEEDWSRLRAFYLDTCWRKGSEPYLTEAFFTLLAERCRHRVVVGYARRNGLLVAASLNFEKGKHLYGRYWGCEEDQEMLHFELCYYQLIERAIAGGMTRFEAGAQGTHKLRRGLMPSEIHSAHFIAHPVLRDAVADYLPRERAGELREMAALAEHGPFRRGDET
ncbi:MAG: N-acetyltransferase [Myxococcales bacterium]|nr:N-acetyltransferase [Myxococcales bacterium]